MSINACACYICLDINTDPTNITALKCNHTFCSPCITEWLKNNDGCPECNYNDCSKFNDYDERALIEDTNKNDMCELSMYAINYNVLRIMSGMAGLAYSS